MNLWKIRRGSTPPPAFYKDDPDPRPAVIGPCPAKGDEYQALDLNELAHEIHEWARGKGFYDRERLPVNSPFAGHHTPEYLENPSLASEKVALFTEECGELVKALRKGDVKNEAEECADILIRVLDFCAWRGHDVTGNVLEKMAANEDRPYLHGEGRVF